MEWEVEFEEKKEEKCRFSLYLDGGVVATFAEDQEDDENDCQDQKDGDDHDHDDGPNGKARAERIVEAGALVFEHVALGKCSDEFLVVRIAVVDDAGSGKVTGVAELKGKRRLIIDTAFGFDHTVGEGNSL